jgi:hypothetical protein
MVHYTLLHFDNNKSQEACLEPVGRMTAGQDITIHRQAHPLLLVVAGHRRTQWEESKALTIVYKAIHLKVADAASREDASTSWPSSSGLRGRTGTYLSYHFIIGRLCPF